MLRFGVVWSNQCLIVETRKSGTKTDTRCKVSTFDQQIVGYETDTETSHETYNPRWNEGNWLLWIAQCDTVRKNNIQLLKNYVMALDTFGCCQRPVSSHGVSQCKITNLWSWTHNWSSKLQENNKKDKTPFFSVCFQMPKASSLKYFIIWANNITSFSKSTSLHS